MLQLKPKEPVPVYGSPLAIGLLEHKMRENRVEKYASCGQCKWGSGCSSASFLPNSST